MLLETRLADVHGASVVARWTLAYPDKPAASGLTLLVLRPRGNGWEIVQDASMSAGVTPCSEGPPPRR